MSLALLLRGPQKGPGVCAIPSFLGWGGGSVDAFWAFGAYLGLCGSRGGFWARAVAF